MHPVIFWDIDGTLLSTKGRGFPHFFNAISEVFGIQGTHQDFSISHGLTDFEAIGAILKVPVENIPKRELQFCIDVYEQKILDVFQKAPPIVLPEIHNALTLITSQTNWTLGIGTGNSPGGARVKLSTSGLLDFFDKGRFFCSEIDALTRIEVIKRCENSLGSKEIGIVIGDTPNDVACAKATGLMSIAVPSGAFDFQALAICGADETLALEWRAEDLMDSITEFSQSD